MSLAHQIHPAPAIDRVEHTPPVGVRWHEYADIFPWIEGPAFEELKSDIAKNGVLEPIVFLDGAILDGRNRYMAARALGIEYPRVEYQGDDPLGFVISHNLKRRHLDAGQRARVAAKIATMQSGARTDIEPSANLRQVSIDDAAQMMNVSPRLVDTARKVERDGVPELVQAVDAGKVSVSAAAVIAKQDEDTQKRILAEDNLKRAAAELREAEKQAKEAEALPKAAPLTPEQKAEQERVFGTQESRAVFIDALNITEKVAAFPDPEIAVSQIPPALEHAVDIEAFREVARWFDAFCNAVEAKEKPSVAAE